MKHFKLKSWFFVTLLAARAAEGATPDVTVAFRIHDEITARGVAGMGVPGGVKGWDRRILYISGDRTAEHSFGALPGMEGVETIKKVRVETPTWGASFEPDSGMGIRRRYARYRAGGLIASSDTAEFIERTHLLQHLGDPVGRRVVGGQVCDFFRPDPDYVKAELCIGDVSGRRIVLFMRLYERGTVWSEEAQSVVVGGDIPESKFEVPATVQEGEALR